MLLAPLHYRDKLLGVIKVLSVNSHAFDEVDRQVLALTAQVVSASAYACRHDWIESVPISARP